MILKLEHELILSYSWDNFLRQGICGHTYEVIEYFYILSKYFKVYILICNDITWEIFEKALRKYNFSDEVVALYKERVIIKSDVTLLICKNIIIVDGFMDFIIKKRVIADNIILFACSDLSIKDNTQDNVFILQDNRIYKEGKNTINYKKKILFDKMKPTKHVETISQDNLLYTTSVCRQLTNEDYNNILKLYDGKFLIINSDGKIQVKNDRLKYMMSPVDNIFEKFSTYIYTPINRKWDCSSRFIAECKFFDKQVQYYNIDEQYLNIDIALRWRKYDVEKDFKSLYLQEDDEIINIIKDIIV